MLTFLLFDLQTSVRGQNEVEFYQESTGHVRFFLALLLAVIANERLKILIFLLFDLKTSGRGQNGVEFNQESTGHVLLLANERLNFARNPMIVVPDMCQISFYTCRERGLTNGYGHLSIYCFSAINKNNKIKYIFLNLKLLFKFLFTSGVAPF